MAKRECIVAFPLQDWKPSYWWQLHARQEENKMSVLSCFDGNSGYDNTPQCYVKRTLSVLCSLTINLYLHSEEVLNAGPSGLAA